MKPNEISQQIRRMANAVQSSSNPSRELVARDLRRLIAQVAGENDPKSEGGEIDAKVKNFIESMDDEGLSHENKKKMATLLCNLINDKNSKRHLEILCTQLKNKFNI